MTDRTHEQLAACAESGALQAHDVRPEHVHTHALLAEVLAEVRGLRRELTERPPRPVLARLHARVLAPLLPEISAAVGAAVWSCRELLDECRRDRDLARAIESAVGPIDDAIVRRLGNLLAAGEGHVVAGHMVTLHERRRDGARWSVERT